MKLLTIDKIRAWDQYTIAHEPVSSEELMERAARACSDWIIKHYPGPRKVMVFCGTGNNGGDGLAIARHLDHARYEVDVFLLEGKKRTADFKHNLRLWDQMGQKATPVDPGKMPPIPAGVLLIDALCGTGVKGALRDASASLVKAINASSARIISIDIPSGLNGDLVLQPEGAVVMQAAYTLSFQLPKYAFLFPENGQYTGYLHLLDIGLDAAYPEGVKTDRFYTDLAKAKSIYKPRKKFAHKGDFGHALLIAGSQGRFGAAVLAATACLRSGSGLLTLHAPDALGDIIHTSLPEAMFSSDPGENSWSAVPDISAFAAIGIGPGLGKAPSSKQALLELLSAAKQPMVLDADALSLLAELWNEGKKISLPRETILSPHPKEFERLAGKVTNSEDRIKLLLDFAARHQAYVILKGAHSCVATPSGELHFNSTGNPGLAKGGSGDVLTGMLIALLAQGYDAGSAALLGVYLHGLAADLAMESSAVESLTSRDVTDYLPAAFRAVRDNPTLI